MKQGRMLRRRFLLVAVIGLAVIVLGGETIGNALSIEGIPESSSINTSTSTIAHLNGMTEHYDGMEGKFAEGPAPAIDIYIRQEEGFLPDFTNRVDLDYRSQDSMTAVNYEITGRNLPTPSNVDLVDVVEEVASQNNMTNKKIVMKLYQRADDGQGGYTYNYVADYSGWNMHESGQPIELTISNGITVGDDFYPSHKLEVSFIANADGKADYDFNNDGKRDMKDFAELSRTWGKTGNYLADTTGPAGISDGNVDMYDLVEFVSEWLD